MKDLPVDDVSDSPQNNTVVKGKTKNEFMIGFIILCFLFVVAIIVVVAGYNFVVGFGVAEGTSIRNLLSAEKGTAIIIVGIFLEILIGILIYDLKQKQMLQITTRIKEKMFREQEKTNKLLEELVAKK